MRLSWLDLLGLDVETTGPLPGVDAVIEVAVVLLDEQHGEPTADWSSLVSPWREVDATDTHGLTAKHLAGVPVLGEIAGRLDELLPGRVLVGHNIGFDLAMLAAEWRRLGQRRAWPSADTQEAAAVLGRRDGKARCAAGRDGSRAGRVCSPSRLRCGGHSASVVEAAERGAGAAGPSAPA